MAASLVGSIQGAAARTHSRSGDHDAAGTVADPKSRPRNNDLRTGGRWTAAQWLKNTLIYWAVVAGIRWADLLSPRWLLSVTRSIGRVAYLLAPRARERGIDNLALLGDHSRARRIVRASFSELGRNLGYCLQLRRPATRASDLVDLGDESHAALQRALAVGRGVVFVSAHLGPFELVAAMIAELGYRPAIVVRQSYDPRLDRWVDEHRIARGVEVIHRGSAGATRRILRALKSGRPVGFLPDLGGRVAKIPATFLGQEALLPVGPQRIASRFDIPVVIGTLQPGQSTRPFRLEIRALPTDLGEERLTQRVADELSDAILRAPEHWPWMAPSLGTN